MNRFKKLPPNASQDQKDAYSRNQMAMTGHNTNVVAPYEAKIKDLQGQVAGKQSDLGRYQTQITNQASVMPGTYVPVQTDFEKRAGVMPTNFRGLSDIKTGDLIDRFKANPFEGEASQRLRQEALGNEQSPWAKMALQRQGLEESQARGNVGLQQQMAQSQAQSQLARLGGLGGGARTSLARSGAHDALMAAQGVGAQGQMARAGINEQDALRHQQLLGQTADIERAGRQADIGSLKEDMLARGGFDTNRYNQQMQAWASQQSANAQRQAGSSGKGK